MKRDFPEPGMVTLSVVTLPATKECPLIDNKVRATLSVSMVLKEIVDETSKKVHTEVFMTNMCDINGFVPKWIVNAGSKRVPKIWFKTYEIGCQKFMED